MTVFETWRSTSTIVATSPMIAVATTHSDVTNAAIPFDLSAACYNTSRATHVHKRSTNILSGVYWTVCKEGLDGAGNSQISWVASNGPRTYPTAVERVFDT